MTNYQPPHRPPSTSLTLLERLSAEPHTADWQRLVGVYSPLLSSWCDRMGVPVSDRDDQVQETLIIVIRGVARFEHRGAGSFRGWLRTILSNQLKNYFRRHKPLLRSDWESLRDDNSGLSRRFDHEHDLHIARIAMERVQQICTERAWQAFEMLMLRQLPLAQVAEHTGLTANAVVKARARILKRIQAEMKTLIEY